MTAKGPAFRKSVLAGLVLALWAGIVTSLSLTGYFERYRSAKLFAWGLAIPALSYSAAYLGSATVRNWVRHLRGRALTFCESPRFLGGTYLLWEYSQGRLPPAFSLIAGISDIVVAVSAIPAAWFLVSGSGMHKPGFRAWHIFGLVCLGASGSSGMLTSPGPMNTFPLVLIPMFFGPTMVLFHLAALSLRPVRSGGGNSGR
jgi:hypothetical protein